PGPRGWPIVGYLRTIEEPVSSAYRQWSEIYKSDIVGVNILGNNIVIANTLKVATGLLETRSAIYSDRCLTMMRELVKFDWNMGVARYDSHWRDTRKAASQGFHQQAILRYRPSKTKATLKLLRNLM
ncbi:uncharacterized protein PHACADRAFT_57990, partial [Phanerochaete carnosa HHB-10118-sp]